MLRVIRAKPCLSTVAVLAAIFLATPAFATLDGCAKVLATPDGFLALRAGPGLRFAQSGRLIPGDELWVTDMTCQRIGRSTVCDETGRWMHVSNVRRLDAAKSATTEGWVSRRYLTMHECE